ncbi:hypothetical protein [Hydrogenophaga sp.]|uniref:hypothetical protein n=1 Tax=Hydrogenophaga sp. TaxID=1904254 RepID=UPI003AF5F4C1
MLLFLDTEFTDFIDIDLISIGLVSEDGLHVFYAERNDYRIESASDFVRAAVLPQLGSLPNVICSREGLTLRLYDWFRTLPEHVKIACDSAHDRDLLWDAFEDGLPSNLDPRLVELAWRSEDARFNAALERYYLDSGFLRHHAFHDASALRAGWLAVKR